MTKIAICYEKNLKNLFFLPFAQFLCAIFVSCDYNLFYVSTTSPVI